MNCGRSSSVEWKLPKLQRRVRFPSPAPPPPGRAPGGFVIAVRDARVQRGPAPPSAHEGTPRPHNRMRHCAAGKMHDTRVQHAGDRLQDGFVWCPHHCRSGQCRKDLAPEQSASKREETRPARPLQQQFREKTRPAQSKRAHFGTKLAQLARNAAFSLI